MNKLTEGSLHGELKETILPLITIDEFEPKSGLTDEVIVIGFYVTDEEPAKDLEQFLEKSAFDTLDTEVSPNPNEDGYYIVFVEIERNEKFFETFLKIVEDVENLAGELVWRISTYISDELYDIDDPELPANIVTSSLEYVTQDEYDTKQVTEYFKESWLSTLVAVKQDNNITVTLGSGALSQSFRVHALDSMDNILKEHDIKDHPIDLLYESSELRFLKNVLSSECNVNFVNGYYVVDKKFADSVMLLK